MTSEAVPDPVVDRSREALDDLRDVDVEETPPVERSRVQEWQRWLDDE